MTQSDCHLILLTNDLYQDPFPSPAVEFPVEDLLPRPKIKFTICHSNHHFPSHDLAFHVRIGIVFTRVVVTVLVHRLVRGEFFQPFVEILVSKSKWLSS